MIKFVKKFILLVIIAVNYISTTESLKTRIIGGESADIVETPYLVSLRYKKSNNTAFEHRCSGTIYTTKVILTTARCVIGLDRNRIHIKAGSSNRSQNDGYLYLVERYVIHPEYNIWLTDNDLALVILALELTTSISKEIAPIALAKEIPVEGSLTTIAGWGITDASVNSKFSETLQFAHVYIVNDSVCKRSYGENRITTAMLCAAGTNTDACLGDAGGALVYKNTALGLISWGNGCTHSSFPGVYTNLVYFREWIQNEVKNVYNNFS